MTQWRGRQLVIDHMRNVDREMIECGLCTSDVLEVLEQGVSPVKRRRGIHEKWMRIGWSMVIVVVEDCGEYWLLRHVSKVKLNKRLSKVLRGEKR